MKIYTLTDIWLTREGIGYFWGDAMILEVTCEAQLEAVYKQYFLTPKLDTLCRIFFYTLLDRHRWVSIEYQPGKSV
jgi:hypothetical protein